MEKLQSHYGLMFCFCLVVEVEIVTNFKKIHRKLHCKLGIFIFFFKGSSKIIVRTLPLKIFLYLHWKESFVFMFFCKIIRSSISEPNAGIVLFHVVRVHSLCHRTFFIPRESGHFYFSITSKRTSPCMLWFTPSRQLSSMQPFTATCSFLLSRMGEKIKRVKVRKLMG